MSGELFFGQQVIVWARWILIGAGLVLSFWNPPALWMLEIQLATVIALAFGNFYLHLQLLRGRQTIDVVVWGASLGDLAVVTALVMVLGGFSAPVFIFYFAAVLGFSVAFPTQLTALYTAGTMVIYAMVCAATTGPENFSVIFTRALMIATVAVCGNLFHRNESHRRAEAIRAHDSVLEDIGSKPAAEPANA